MGTLPVIGYYQHRANSDNIREIAQKGVTECHFCHTQYELLSVLQP